MSDTEMTVLVDRGLTAAEKEKFNTVHQRLSELFWNRGKLVRVCEGRGEGAVRQIAFMEESDGAPFMAVPAHWFLTVSADDFISRLRSSF